MKKRTVAICLCIVLVLGGIAATLAYFTDDDSATNTFTVGKVEITLDETDVDNSADGDRDTENSYKLIPGNTYIKDPTIHVADNSEDCWLFVTVVADKRITAIEVDDASMAAQMEANGWKALDGVTFSGAKVYAYETKVSAGAEKNVFSSITVDGDKADNNKMEAVESSFSQIVIKAYAIQAEGFDTAAEAWQTAYTQF